MYPLDHSQAEIAYRRARLAEAFRAGTTGRVQGAGRHHHLPIRKRDRRS
jgi:hypothetical protein